LNSEYPKHTTRTLYPYLGGGPWTIANYLMKIAVPPTPAYMVVKEISSILFYQYMDDFSHVLMEIF